MHDLQPFSPTFLLWMKHLKYWSSKFFALKRGQATSRCRQYLSVTPGKLSTHLSWGLLLNGLLSLQDNAKYLRTKPNKRTNPPILHSHISKIWRDRKTLWTEGGKGYPLYQEGLFRGSEQLRAALSTVGREDKILFFPTFMCLHLSRCWRHHFSHHSQCSHSIKPKGWPWHKTPAVQTPLTALISSTQCKLWNQHHIQTPVPLWSWNTHLCLSSFSIRKTM